MVALPEYFPIIGAAVNVGFAIPAIQKMLVLLSMYDKLLLVKFGIVSLAAGGILGPVKNIIPVIVENGIGRISAKTVEDSIKGLKPIDNEIVNLNAVGKKFEEALKETEWFMDYLAAATTEDLTSKGEILINNLFVIIQNLNAISPSAVMSVVTKVISAGNEFYDKLNLEARILEAKKNK